MKKIPLLFAAAAYCACTGPAPSNTPAAETSLAPQAAPQAVAAVIRGLYEPNGRLTACADGKTYRVADKTGVLDSLYRIAAQPAPYPNEAVFMAASGYINAGEVFDLHKIDTLSAKNKFNCCLPYDFWCSGTEPFWSLQISEREQGLFFKNIGEETGLRFPWSAPAEKNGRWEYAAQNGKDQIRITISKTPCNDGMSDMRYQFAVSLQINGQSLSGCAVRYGESIPRE